MLIPILRAMLCPWCNSDLMETMANRNVCLSCRKFSTVDGKKAK